MAGTKRLCYNGDVALPPAPARCAGTEDQRGEEEKMKRGFFLGLLLAGAALFSGCGMLRGAAKLLGSEESRERFA